ncbi:cytochrome C oxidase subunit IV family protein [Paracidovorax wautersii]|uniref:Cytochrome C oxidase subunit IV n=1 Tax=Paracidovorax wautersii TaxID=1177982 RepID=A0ABU1I9D4_9BURK|nr:cytochrome C oxidase subunit IV family protein [Paracidovorax wautersii]MDR6213837.1 hypothetical protein [Paracidovorax wautersii]
MKTRHRPFLVSHSATLAWLALLLLTAASVGVVGHAHHGGSRLGMALAVAGIAWVKGRLLIRHYLEARRAGPMFLRIVTGFCALAPLALVASALREFLRG